MKNYGEREREWKKGVMVSYENGEGVMVTAQQKTLVTVFCSNVRDSF
jgi:hypothetical protein